MKKEREILEHFVVFEGIDGTGTTTQLTRLQRRLAAVACPHAVSCEPTNGPIGTLIRESLAGTVPLHPHTVARLFAADRAEHLYGNGGIVASSAAGLLAISDRYLFSSLAYQGLTCGQELPAALNAGFPLPGLLLFFDLDPKAAMDRMAGRSKLDIYENLEFQKQVAAAYRHTISNFEGLGMQIVRIDASLQPEAVERAVWKAVEPLVLDTNDKPET
ncbi:MAG: dTMP kinase [Clostridia bacterium]|nr:dTMP kinase [Spirochaetia bacterium]